MMVLPLHPRGIRGGGARARSVAAAAGTEQIQPVRTRTKASAANGLLEQRLERTLGTDTHREVLDHTAVDTDQVVMVSNDLFGEFVPLSIIRAGNALHDPDLFEHCQVPVDRTLGQLRLGFDQFVGGDRPSEIGEKFDQLPTARGVPLANPGDHRRRRIMHPAALITAAVTGSTLRRTTC